MMGMLEYAAAEREVITVTSSVREAIGALVDS